MRLALIPLTGVALIALAGCVPQNQYDDLMTAYRAKEQQLLQMQNEFDTARANEEMLRKQLGEAMASLAQIKDSGNRAEIEALQGRIADLMKQIGQTKLAMLPVGETYIELLEATGPESGVAKWIGDKATGLFHICFEVEDIEQAYIQSWKIGAKAISIYRDGSKRTQPLNTSKAAIERAGQLGQRLGLGGVLI